MNFKKLMIESSLGLLTLPFISEIGHKIIGSFATVFVLHRSDKGSYSSRGISKEYLESCLKYLVSHDYHFLNLSSLINKLTTGDKVQPKTVIFTLDDGYMDQADNLIPVLLEYGVTPNFFVITDLLDGKDWPWDSKISWLLENTKNKHLNIKIGEQVLQTDIDSSEKRRLMRHRILDSLKQAPADKIPGFIEEISTRCELEVPGKPPDFFRSIDWDQARELEKKGVRFSPHSQSHRIFSGLSREEVSNEIAGSWEKLKKELRQPEKIFCYPTGRRTDFSEEHIELLKQQNFLGSVTTVPEFIFHDSIGEILYTLPRLDLPLDFVTFKRYMSWIEAARQKYF